MKLQGEHKFQAPRELVWEVLNRTDALSKCTPGCKELVQINEEEYEAKLEMGVAAIKGKYDGKIVLSNKTVPEELTLQINAEGTAGVVNATAHLKFVEADDYTIIEYEGEGQIGTEGPFVCFWRRSRCRAISTICFQSGFFNDCH